MKMRQIQVLNKFIIFKRHKTNKMNKIITLSLILMTMISAHAQTTEGDALLDVLGSKVNTAAAKQFLSAYSIKRTADGIFSATTTGIDIRTSHDTIVSMTLYHDNPIYGKYTNKLPKGIKFDMTSAEIIKMLGKPATTYSNSGYCEYHFGRKVLTCWFEKEVLRRVTVSLK